MNNMKARCVAFTLTKDDKTLFRIIIVRDQGNDISVTTVYNSTKAPQWMESNKNNPAQVVRVIAQGGRDLVKWFKDKDEAKQHIEKIQQKALKDGFKLYYTFYK